MEKVIVAITTFNLEKYIAQSLDSVLMQKTDFAYKIIVADDHSSDSTLTILYDYASRYPEKIEILPSDKNIGSLGNSNRLFDGIDCEYFSFLDGDDYWLTDDRLQLQVNFLDNHPDYSMCGGNTILMKDDNITKKMIDETKLDKTYCFDDYVAGKMPFVHTSSILLRNTIFKKGIPKMFTEAVGTYNESALRGEDFRRLLHLQKGPIYLFNNCWSVYRIHNNGLWQGTTTLRRFLDRAISDSYYYRFFEEKYKSYFLNRHKNSYRDLMKYLIKEDLLYPEYKLNRKESSLLSGYLNDMPKGSDGDKSIASNIRKLLFKLIFRITN